MEGTPLGFDRENPGLKEHLLAVALNVSEAGERLCEAATFSTTTSP